MNKYYSSPLEEVWDFIPSPRNLKEITPAYMEFDITSIDLPEKMYPGMNISYKVSPLLGIKIAWVTEITQLREFDYFINEQRVGPYKLWHHQHIIKPSGNGGPKKDIVTYESPLGFLGTIAIQLFIKSKLNEIFDYRKMALEKKYGTTNVC